MLVTSTPSAALSAGSTRSYICTANVAPVSNTRAHLCTASVAPKASINKYRKLSAPPPLGPPKPGQYTKPIKVTWITYIKLLINYSQRIQF
jgi:hypothetical protein